MLNRSADESVADTSVLSCEEALVLLRAALGKDHSAGLLLAVSGGPDSIAMLGLLGAARAMLPPMAVATVDHGLRAEAAHEAATVKDFANRLGLAHQTLLWREHSGQKISQEAARKGRYALLIDHARLIGASHLVTAHTLDDQAETVMMRLTRGSGTMGLGGMRSNVRRGLVSHLRPFLGVSKTRILATCARNGWLYALDPTNTDPHYTRTRLRTLMPLLADEGLTAERLGTLAARARRTEDAIQQVSQRMIDENITFCARDGGALRLKATPFLTEPFEIALRMLRNAMLMIAPPEAEETQIPLAKLENVLRNLRIAIHDQQPLRTSLAFAIIAQSAGVIEIRIAPPRRHG